MSTETKSCPYCAEEINVDAIKCKHCGEFLNKIYASNNPLQPELKIEAQDFSKAIMMALAAIVLTFLEAYFESNKIISWKISFFTLVADVSVWYYLREYLENFKVDKILKKINWIIALTIISGSLGIIADFLPESNYFNELANNESLSLILFGFLIIIMISLIVILISTGNSLQKIKNDSIGLLKELGIAISYIYPIAFIVIIVGSIMENQIINISGLALESIPTIIMFLLFIRARKFVKVA